MSLQKFITCFLKRDLEILKYCKHYLLQTQSWKVWQRLRKRSKTFKFCLQRGVATSSYAWTRGVTICVFVPNRHGTDISVRCMRPYNEYRQFTPNPERGARSNATLFDNRQQKNSECRELHTWKQSPLDSDHVLILNVSLTDKGVHFKGLRTQLFAKWSFVLMYPTSLIWHKSKYSIIFPYLWCICISAVNRL